MRTIIFFLVFSAFGQAQSYSDLDRPLRRHPTLGAFLNDSSSLARYKKLLEAYYGPQTFSCERFEVTVERLRGLVAKFPALAERLWEPVSSPTIGPFQEVTGKKVRAEFRFVPLPRRLHALWADTASGCGAESCAVTESLGDRRWRVAREGSSLFVLERDRKFTGGFVHVIPLTPAGAPRFLVLRGGSRLLEDQRSFSNVVTGKAVRSSAFHAWLDFFGAGTPAAQAAFAVLGEEKADKIPGVVARTYPTGESLGPLAGLLAEDGLMAEAVKTLPKRCDPTTPVRVAALSPLKSVGASAIPGSVTTSTTSVEGPPAKITNDAFALMGTPNGPAQIQRLSPEAKKRLADALPETLISDPKPQNRARAAALMNLLGTPGFVDVPSLPGARPASIPPPLIEYKEKFADGFTKALADSVPQIRGMAAMGLDAATGGSGGNAEVARNLAAASPLPPKLFGEPQAAGSGDRARRELEDRAVRSMLDRGMGVSRDKVDRLMDNALNETDPERRKRKIDGIADLYFRNRDIEGSLDALGNRDRWPPDFVEEILREIDNKPPDVCRKAKEIEEKDGRP